MRIADIIFHLHPLARPLGPSALDRWHNNPLEAAAVSWVHGDRVLKPEGVESVSARALTLASGINC